MHHCFSLSSLSYPQYFFQLRTSVVKLNNNPQIYLHPNPQNLQMLPYMAKKDFAAVIKLRLLRWRDDPGLSSQVLNVITSVLLRGRFPHREREGHATMRETGTGGVSFEDGWRGYRPRTPGPLQAQKDKEMVSPSDSPEGTSPADTSETDCSLWLLWGLWENKCLLL